MRWRKEGHFDAARMAEVSAAAVAAAVTTVEISILAMLLAVVAVWCGLDAALRDRAVALAGARVLGSDAAGRRC